MSLINPRWVHIPEDEIYRALSWLRIRNWFVAKNLFVFPDGHTTSSFYLHGVRGGKTYSYPYSLPEGVAEGLKTRLNIGGRDVNTSSHYNSKAMRYFEENGVAENQAEDYWREVGNNELPKPRVIPLKGLAPGDIYYALIGLYHMRGDEFPGGSALYVDILDHDGRRMVGTKARFWWDDIQEGQKPHQIITIEKKPGEPGANIFITWHMALGGFIIEGRVSDTFEGVHSRYPRDSEGNFDGHHRHYVVFQAKTVPEREDPPPPPDKEGIVILDPPRVISHTVEWVRPGVLKEKILTEVYTVDD